MNAAPPVLHRLSGLIAGWRQAAREHEDGWRATGAEADHAVAKTLREVDRQVGELLPDLTALAERAYAAPVSRSQVRRLTKQQGGPPNDAWGTEPQPAPGPDVCECGHYWAHHAFSDDVCAVADCPCTRPRPPVSAAPELAAAMAEARGLRELVAEILDAFGPTGSGRIVRQQHQVARWRERSGLPS